MTRAPVHLPIRNPNDRPVWFRISHWVALVASVFCVIITATLILNFIRDRAESPLVAADLTQNATLKSVATNAPPLVLEIQKLQIALAANPEDDTLKDRIRDIDLELRIQHFGRRDQMVRGAYFLLAGLAVLLLSLKASTQFGPIAPGMMTAFPPLADPWKKAAVSRRAISLASCILIAILLAVALNQAPSFSTPAPATGLSAVSSDPGPSLEEILHNWPSFRGPQGSASTAETVPTRWDGPAGTNILWKSPIPLPGNNSPIVWANRIFFSGANNKKQEVYCYNADTGELLWQRPVTGPVAASSLELNDETGYAPSTMATDGRRVYAIFPTGDLAAFDFNGQPLWSQNLGKPQSIYGHASSLATYKNRVIIQFDQGDDAKKNLSALLALDGATGKAVWKTKRAVCNSWPSPIVIYPESSPQIITAANPLVAAYNPDDGKELWHADLLEGDVAATPIFSSGLAFAVSDQTGLFALRIDGHGDVATSHLAWTAKEGLPDIVSPLATPDLVLLVEAQGKATCFDAHSGQQLWQHDLEETCHASPTLVGKTIYLTQHNGVTRILDAGPEYKELAVNPLGEPVSASPAFLHGHIYFRAKFNLYCIGAK